MSQLTQDVPTISKYPNYHKISQLSQNVPTISKFPNHLKMSQLSQSFPTIWKCPNYFKMSQLSQNVPIHYFKIFQRPPEGNFACRIKFSWRIIPLTKIKIVWKYARWMNLCEIIRKMLKYAKMCGKHQIVRKVAENVKLCDSALTAPKRCPCCLVI